MDKRKANKIYKLEYLEIQQYPIGTPHNILRSVKNRKYDIQKTEIKLRLITDTYMLQYHHAKFSRNKNISDL